MDFLSIHGGGGGQRGVRLTPPGQTAIGAQGRGQAVTTRGGFTGITFGARQAPAARSEARIRLGRQIAGGRRG